MLLSLMTSFPLAFPSPFPVLGVPLLGPFFSPPLGAFNFLIEFWFLLEPEADREEQLMGYSVAIFLAFQ